MEEGDGRVEGREERWVTGVVFGLKLVVIVAEVCEGRFCKQVFVRCTLGSKLDADVDVDVDGGVYGDGANKASISS